MTGLSEGHSGPSQLLDESLALLNHRTPIGRAFSAANTAFHLALQWCPDCEREQYPPAEVCGGCLGTDIQFRISTGKGQLLSRTELSHSLIPYFQHRMLLDGRWLVGLIRLDSGPIVFAHLSDGAFRTQDRVQVFTYNHPRLETMLIAMPAAECPVTTGEQCSVISRLSLDRGVNPAKDEQ
jgi:uncharacterized OB-fold protein